MSNVALEEHNITGTPTGTSTATGRAIYLDPKPVLQAPWLVPSWETTCLVQEMGLTVHLTRTIALLVNTVVPWKPESVD